MRDKHYEPFTFRLDKRTRKKLQQVVAELHTTYNLLFLAFIETYDVGLLKLKLKLNRPYSKKTVKNETK